MRRHSAHPLRFAVLGLLSVAPLSPSRLFAQAPLPDVVVFTNGERLTGVLETADSGGITFKSPVAGEIKSGWGNIAELTSSKKFAVLDKKVKLKRKDASALVPQGTVALDAKDKTLIVTTASGPKTVPIADASHLIDPAAFDKAVNHPPGFFHGYTGAITAGATLVRSTQDTTTYNGGIALIRVTPTVDWLPSRDRTTLDFNQTYGTVSQSGQPDVKTNIIHGDAERDEYFSARMFGFGSVAVDHNYSQSLQLQQAYGGGVGITLIKNAKQELDFKGDVHYEKQEFFIVPPALPPASPSQNIFGSTFSDTYTRHMYKSILFNEFASISPAWNNSKDYSAHANAGLTFPVYHGLAFNVAGIDDYLNNAPVGSKRNSVQFLLNVVYKFK